MAGRDRNTRVVLLFGSIVVTSWPLLGRGRADLGFVDELARLQLAARRVGCSIQLQRAGPELSQLLVLTGLADVLSGPGRSGPTRADPDGLSVEVGRQAEGGEEVGIEEVGDDCHPTC